MAKQVKINNFEKVFPTQKAALEYFEELKQRNIEGNILVGPDAAAIKAAYEDYCGVTGWTVPYGIEGFSVGNKVEEVSPGVFRTHSCFWYHLADGSKHDFSIINAVKKISNKSD